MAEQVEAEPVEEEAKETITDKMQEDAKQEPIEKEATEEVKIAHDPTPKVNFQQEPAQ